MNPARQDIFDRVATHLLLQGRPALNAEGYCKLRGNDGTKCAVGCLIPDERYHQQLEQIAAVYDPEQGNTDPFLLELIGVHDDATIYLLSRLQMLHDEEDSPVWGEGLLMLACEHQLSDAVVREILGNPWV